MMTPIEGTLLRLTGGVRLKRRVQHPTAQECWDRKAPYWFIHYRDDVLQSDGTHDPVRKRHIIGPSRGPDAIGKREAQTKCEEFLAQMNAAPSAWEAAAAAKQPVEVGAIIFGRLAEMWRTDFVDREVGGRGLIAKATREKYINHLENHIQPRWKDTRLGQTDGRDQRRIHRYSRRQESSLNWPIRRILIQSRIWIANLKHQGAAAWVFPQDEDHRQVLWDSGVRKALKLAAAAEGCDFLGLGPHSLRRANVTWRQEVGGSSIETSQIAGHANTKITEEYTVVQLRRQEELTRRVQSKRSKAAKKAKANVVEIKKAESAA
jgi:hypothetical protein